MPPDIDPSARPILEAIFPRLTTATYSVTSRRTPTYNCIAWAADDDQQPWWPTPRGAGGFWPPHLPEDETLDNFEQAFATKGYTACTDSSHEEGFEKVAIYAKSGVPTHAAKQLANGSWTSKCGRLHDIEHAKVDDVGGNAYGDAVLFMKRAKPSSSLAPTTASATAEP